MAHFEFFLEHFVLGFSVASTKTVPKRRELSIVEVKVQVVKSMTRGSVDHGTVSHVFTIVNHDRPDVDKDEEYDISHLADGEQECIDMIRQALGVAIERMEGVGCVRSWHNPLVMRLVDVLVDGTVVEAAMDPINEKVREEYEERVLREIVPSPGSFG